MRKVLITGINGFIGHNLANFMVNNGYEVWGTYRNNIKCYDSRIKYIKCDLSLSLKIEEKFDVVIHLASQVETSDTYDYIKNTVTATKNLVEYCEMAKVSYLIFMSSIGIYGETDIEVNELSDTKNINTYGMAKLFSETIIKEANIQTKIILRLPRVLGNGVNVNHQWLPALTYSLSCNKDIKYFNSQLEYNNFMDVDDLSFFLDTLIKDLWCKQVDEVIVLGAVQKKKILDIIYFLRDTLESKSKLINVGDRKTTVFSIDVSKAQRFGYSPRDTNEVLEKFANSLQTMKE